ncbi:aldo/keto reductase [Pseudomonas zeae]|jgi:aryl-alcohol dehydrogenase-like predicted oxidoreductase|uniref:aldo/keto reductase n=1 Tax=Pseudomonas zeae TaxID=2745510 RepID=UPI00214761CB|nr:aldo/keto reductase [Pseudomonas zeae]UUT11187.1 aldo/keto reductase [Pseudomonas zeae]
MPILTPSEKQLVLGTALWGWGIERDQAYHLLEQFLLSGGTMVDTATNYPINKRSEDFGLAVRWLADWAEHNADSNLALTVKIGSRDNMGSPDVHLAPDDIARASDILMGQFGSALSCVSIHWDNRSDDDVHGATVAQTVEAMYKLEQQGLAIGLSGIRHPEAYYKANPSLSQKWIIQVKENFKTHAARSSYEAWFPDAKYLAYGINLGGLKTEVSKTNSSMELRNINIPQAFTEKLVDFINAPHEFEPRPTTLNELALAASFVNPALSGIVIGPRNTDQLDSTLTYWKSLQALAEKSKGQKIFTQLFEELPSD